MSIATVVTKGFGSFGSVNLVATHGFDIGDEVIDVAMVIPFVVQFSLIQAQDVQFNHVQQRTANYEHVKDTSIKFTR